RLIGTVQDVTSLHDLEGMLARAQRMEAMGRLAGGVAHDFNNLLATIVLTVALLQKKEGAGELADGLREIEDAASRPTNLTRQLLAFARRQPIAPRVVHVGEVISGVESLLTRLAGPDVALEVRVAPETGFAKVDPTQLEQVLVNLVVNARDAM